MPGSLRSHQPGVSTAPATRKTTHGRDHRRRQAAYPLLVLSRDAGAAATAGARVAQEAA
jgi:hypothetical protein